MVRRGSEHVAVNGSNSHGRSFGASAGIENYQRANDKEKRRRETTGHRKRRGSRGKKKEPKPR